MRKNKLLLLLALLMTAVTGAWAQDAKHLITATYREQTRSLEQPLPYATTIGELYEAVSGQSFSDLISSMSSVGMPLTGITSRNTSIVSIGEFNGASTPVTVIADGETIINLIFGSYVQGIPVSAISPLYAYMKDGVKDADKWTVKVGEGQAQALPIGGLKGDGKETVTLQYNGRLKVKGVTAVKEAAAWDGTFTAQLAAKLAYTDATDGLTTMTWAVGEHIAILYEVSGTKKVADAEITAVDGTTGAATITFKVEAGTPDNTPCTLVYPYDAAKDDHTGVKDAATLLAAQDGTLSANLDVRVGAGTIQTTTPGLTVTTQPEAQFAIFKFTTKSVPSANGSLQNTDVTKLTVTIGAQDYVITPASATSTLYAALPAVSGQTVSFTATGGSNLYAASKASVSFDAAKYYQSTVKMGKVIEVFHDEDPILEDFTRNPAYKYLHIGLEQAYAIARQLSTQNTGATVAVVYNNDNKNVTYALSSDASATACTLRFNSLFANNYRVFLATLWENAD
jgi:hypothetical protein